jgi:hypothetical protein
MTFNEMIENRQLLTEMDLLMDGLEWVWTASPKASVAPDDFRLYYRSNDHSHTLSFTLTSEGFMQAELDQRFRREWSDFNQMEDEISAWISNQLEK